MFGTNPIRSQVFDPSNLAIEEVFYTIQGEGPYSGCPALFIRLSGCNLACHFCDTQFETMIDKAQPTGNHLADIFERFTTKQRKFVVLTGGEPLRQDTSALVTQLLKTGTELIQIETAGTLPMSDTLEELVLTGKIVLVCSPKTPKIHPQIEGLCQHWKYVVKAGGVDPTTGLPNVGTQVSTANKPMQIYKPQFKYSAQTIWISPCDQYNAILNERNQDLARDICLKFGYRLSLQTHKIIGVQ